MAMINLDTYNDQPLPVDWEIESVLDDILMVELVDTDDSGELILRNGIYIRMDVTQKVWRVGKILLKGPKCSDILNIGDFVMFPNDRGIKGFTKKKKHTIFLNEERIFGKVVKVQPEATPEPKPE